MGELSILINNSPPHGFVWKVMGNGKVVNSGAAKTKAEAQTAANKAVRALQKN